MTSNSEHKYQADIDSYLDHSMTESERELFEKRMDSNPELKEEVRLQKSVHEIVFKNEWSTIENDPSNKKLSEIKSVLRSEEYETIYKNIKKAGDSYLKKRQKKKFRNKILYFSSAAAAAILIIVSVTLFNQKDTFDTLYNEYANDWKLTSYIEQNDSQNEFVKGELLYKSKKYKEAISFFENYSKNKEDELYAASLIYLGASYVADNNDMKAIYTFDDLINSDTYDSTKGHWYKLLIYLKQKDTANIKTANIKTVLQTILSDQNNYKYKEALAISERLDL